MNAAVATHLPLVDFLQAILGANSEIVLHDFTDPAHSVVDIRNAQVSGRTVGAPATDFALKVISGGALPEQSYAAGYLAHSAAGKPLRSASYFIRENGEIVGMLCVNTDTSCLDAVAAAARTLAQAYPLADTAGAIAGKGDAPRAALTPDAAQTSAPSDQAETGATRPAISRSADTVEHLTTSADDLVARAVTDVARAKGTEVERFSPADRMDAVRRLEADGVFLIKGAVTHVADALGISEPSVYRYLQKARRERKQ